MKSLLSSIILLSFTGLTSAAVPGYSKECKPPLVMQKTKYGEKCLPCPEGTEYFEGICRIKCPPPLVAVKDPKTGKWVCDKPPPIKCYYGKVPVWDPKEGWKCETPKPKCSVPDNQFLVGAKYDEKTDTFTTKDGKVVKRSELFQPNRVVKGDPGPGIDENRLTIMIEENKDGCLEVIRVDCC
jgi:hypothetical protein